MKRILPFLFAFIFLVAPVAAQEAPEGPTTKDSVKVSVEALRNLKHEFKILERKVELQDTVITEQTRQIELYEKRIRQDSLLNDLNEKQLKIRNERIQIKEEQIQRLERRNLWLKIATGVGTVLGFVLGAT